MAMASVSVTRNVPSMTEDKVPLLIALATITHESGVQQTVAVREDEAMFHDRANNGEQYILKQVEKAILSPQAPQFTFIPPEHKQ